MTMTTCSKCHPKKPLDTLVKDERRGGGCGSWCANCHRITTEIRRATQEAA